MYPRNAASPPPIAIGAIVQISDGAVQTTGVSARVKTGSGSWAAAANSPTCDTTSGIWEYTPSQSETNASSFQIALYKTGCIPVSQTIVTSASAVAGYAGLDWSLINAPTTTQGLSGTTISTSQAVASVSGAVGSVTGNVGGNVTGSVASVTAAVTLPSIPAGWITAAGISAAALNGKGDWNIGKTGYTLTATTGLGNQTANITGNLSGSVGSVTGAVGSIASGGITATSFAAGAIDAAAIATDAIGSAEISAAAVTKIQTGLATPTNITAGTITTVSGNVNGSVGSVTGAVTLPSIPANWLTAAGIAASALNGKGDWNVGKTGYSLTATTGLGNQTANITGNLSGSVGSVTGAVGSVTGAVGSVAGNVGGNVVGSVGSVTGLTASDVGAIKTKTDSLTFTVAGQVDANMQCINDVTITGNGQSGTEFGV